MMLCQGPIVGWTFNNVNVIWKKQSCVSGFNLGRFTFFSLRTSRLEARTGRRQPKTATFTRCTSTSTRSSPTSTKSSPTSSLPLSVMQYQCAQTNLISSVFSLYQSFPKQHRYRKRERLYSHHLAHIHTRRYSPSLFVCEIPEAGKRKITQQQMSYVG